ncbi:CLUMA_CG011146, isoform A [Clunio marinus]|uniref:DNA replication complex GINS protein SLD5 n=1 Tax=Clunio marinus TaxID=568069 RepID=A0A1J1IFI5_9DIPT|nr:CLUMA_CG011146, isoform A [Clunio marinus]
MSDDELQLFSEERVSNDGNDSEDMDEELITPQKLLQRIESAWMNEKHSPDILPFQGEMVDLMLGQLAHMEENLEAIDRNDFRKITHKMELERIRFIVASYLRCRLQKLEEFTQHILTEERKRPPDKKRLSDAEVKFAEDFFESVERHFQLLALRHIPPNQDDITKRIVRPNLMSNVFFRVVKSCGTVVNTNDEEVELLEDSQHMLPYQLISDLIIKGDIQLI